MIYGGSNSAEGNVHDGFEAGYGTSVGGHYAKRVRLEGRLNLLAEVEKELRGLLEGADQPSLPHMIERDVAQPIHEAVEGHMGSAIKEFLYAYLLREVRNLWMKSLSLREIASLTLEENPQRERSIFTY